MKTLRYKFDELWLVAIKQTDMAPELAESIIRNYIEAGVEPDSKMLTPGFMGVWTLIKAQIDLRKRRNLRARERRQERRQSSYAKPSTNQSEVCSVDKDSSANRRTLPPATSPKSEKSSAATSVSSPSSSPVPSSVQLPSSVSLSVSEVAPTVAPSTPSIPHTATPSASKKVPFSSRFRGPGLGAIRRS